MSRRRAGGDARPGVPVAVVCTGGGTHARRVLAVMRVMNVGGVVMVAEQHQAAARAHVSWLDGTAAVPTLTDDFRCDAEGCARTVTVRRDRLETALHAAALAGSDVDLGDIAE